MGRQNSGRLSKKSLPLQKEEKELHLYKSTTEHRKSAYWWWRYFHQQSLIFTYFNIIFIFSSEDINNSWKQHLGADRPVCIGKRCSLNLPWAKTYFGGHSGGSDLCVLSECNINMHTNTHSCQHKQSPCDGHCVFWMVNPINYSRG